ncbi:MAG: dethiobiotin synthase [Candidatus Muproteobacteria bacterium RBG_16_60_9]|uniref:ATP-dependent dethiobiotin synthetase BioD n=1 Tax=Candidatus Muproteobacteria bacterium RBG_16_60_9 TaxID=1817755 RepID=A0A1F6VK39_9PROT|nr:MAG: dethiobiotin synthase [Candidatus Muproteobacteria bacterium RBG_16_60_9]
MNAKPQGWFITGTDTGVGKTAIAEALLAALARRRYRAAGMKPVASGCRRTADGLRSEDAERLRAAASVATDYTDVNPYAFEPAIAPHVAAARAGVAMKLATVRTHYARLVAQVDWLIVEGAGGWYVPFNSAQSMSDVARMLGLPVILVVGLRFGCISHGVLTATAIRADGLQLAAWVGNRIDASFDTQPESIAALQQRLEAPCIGVVPYASNGATIGQGDDLLARLFETRAGLRDFNRPSTAANSD